MTHKKLILIGIVLIIITLLIAPSLCISAAAEGLLLWFNKVLPSLLPFIILINLLVGLNMLEPLSKRLSPITRRLWDLPGSIGFTFLMGLVAGYPMGAKIIKQLVAEKSISLSQGEKALCFCNNCGPLFIIGTVGTMLLENTAIGYFLLFIHILSATLLSLLLSGYKVTALPPQSHLTRSASDFQFAPAFTKAVENGMDTIVCVGGYIIFFSVLTKILTSSMVFEALLNLPPLKLLPNNMAQGILTGILELSNGVGALSKSYLSNPSMYPLALLAFSINFGGFCVYFQTLYVLGDIPFSTKPYLLCKLLQATLSFLLTCTLYPLFSMYTQGTNLQISFTWLITTLLFLPVIYIIIKNYTNKKTSLHEVVYKN
nr:hypothetical protein [uncultured Cellulosilyticum sp.]